MIKNILIAIAITFAIIFAFISSVETKRVSVLEEQIEAHKLAMTFANDAIHTFYNQVEVANK
tara:strand:- start:409 stop:594 length:186 start_codon:yes stop_codon:yes gene_type:complete